MWMMQGMRLRSSACFECAGPGFAECRVPSQQFGRYRAMPRWKSAFLLPLEAYWLPLLHLQPFSCG